MTATAAAGERYYRHPGDLLRLITWAIVAALLVVFIEVSDATSAGVATDLGRAASRVPEVVRELFLVLTQVAAIVVPVVLVVALLWWRRFRRLGMLLLGGAAGAAAFVLVDALIDVPGRLPDAVSTDTWVASSRFPSLIYVVAVAAATLVGKPWLSRQWRRATDVALLVLASAMAVAGTATPAALLLAVAVGFVAGAALLVAVGAPNRRPSAGSVERGLRSAGVVAQSLTLVRAHGGRAELYETTTADGKRLFVKVYDQDSRDADLLFRVYRAALFRGPNEAWPDRSLRAAVEHEALALVMAGKARVRVPALEVVTTLPDRSMVLAMECLDGSPLGDAPEDTIDDATLDAVWRQVDLLHDGHIAHRALNESNVMLHEGEASVVDFASSETSAPELLFAIDRAELLAALTCRVGAERAVASAARVLPKDRLAAAMPYLQPLALSASTRKRTSKATLKQLETATAQATGQEPPPIAQLMRVRPRTLVTTVALAAAFYVLLPQLAHVGGSVTALRTANYGWVAVAVVLSACTYLASAVNLAGAIPHHLPLVPNVETQLAGSFVNRLTPANVGGIALNLRFLQKAGVDTGEAVPGLGLHVASGGIAHAVLLVVFFAWAGQNGIGFKLPDSSKLLVAIAVVLAVAGAVAATRRGRRLVREHVVTFLKEAGASLAKLARWPAKLVMLFGGAFAISLSYICALAAVAFAYHVPVSFAQVGAVFLGASIIAAVAPTPGGLGAMEAALVAGFTGVGVDSAVAVAVVLSYRLLTYWLPVVPGWLSFRSLEHRNLI